MLCQLQGVLPTTGSLRQFIEQHPDFDIDEKEDGHWHIKLRSGYDVAPVAAIVLPQPALAPKKPKAGTQTPWSFFAINRGQEWHFVPFLVPSAEQQHQQQHPAETIQLLESDQTAAAIDAAQANEHERALQMEQMELEARRSFQAAAQQQQLQQQQPLARSMAAEEGQAATNKDSSLTAAASGALPASASGAPPGARDTSGGAMPDFPDGGDRADQSDFYRIGPGRKWLLPSAAQAGV